MVYRILYIILWIMGTLLIGMLGVGAQMLASLITSGSVTGPWWGYALIFLLWALFAQFVFWDARRRARQREGRGKGQKT